MFYPPKVARWVGDIRELFPSPVVQVIQKNAFEWPGLRQMLMVRLESATAKSLRGAMDHSNRTTRPRFADIGWLRTVRKYQHTSQLDHPTLIPDSLVGIMRQRRIAELDEMFLCIEPSGSEGTSVAYASIFSAVMALLPGMTRPTPDGF